MWRYVTKRTDTAIRPETETADAKLVLEIDRTIENNVSTEGDMRTPDGDEYKEKLTFKKPLRTKVRDRIEMFDGLSSKDGDACLMGSGRCAHHNVKLERVTSMKRMSIVDESGVRWEFREHTALVCPGVQQSHKEGRLSDYLRKEKAAISELLSEGTVIGTKKIRLLCSSEMDLSASRKPSRVTD